MAGVGSGDTLLEVVPVSVMKCATANDEVGLPELIQRKKDYKTTSENLETYNAFKDYIETFLIEVYRCKLCKFNSAVKHTIGDHMKIAHFDSASSKIASASGPTVQIDQVNNAGTIPIVSLSDLTTQQNDTVSLSNALEVLMGLGNECSSESITKENHEHEEGNKMGEKHMDNSNLNDFVNVSLSTLKVQMNPYTGGDALAAAAAALNDEEDVEEDPTAIESDHSQGEAPQGYHGYREHSNTPSVPTNMTNNNIQKFQVINKTAPVLQSVDVSAIAKTAALSNPEATTITVVQHNAGEGPPTTIQFKKSRKSDAIIPTRESLGIISPFTKTEYCGSKVFACNKCHSRYKTQLEHDRHLLKKHHRSRKYLCEICGEALATRASVRHHVSRKHPDDTSMFKCEHCDYMTRFEARIKIHRSKHNSEFFCELCNKCYVSIEKLESHYRSPMHKNAMNPIICEHCGYSTKKRDNFLVHMRKHTGEKPYRCTQCDYASSDGSTLKKHVMAKHSNIRPFKCEFHMCNFSCVDKKGLTIHTRKHTGERPFKCHLCNYAAKRKSALNVHMQTHSKLIDSVVKREIQGSVKAASEKVKTPLRQPTEVASYETVTITEVASLPRQLTTPLPQPHDNISTHPLHQFTTMTNYQPPLSTGQDPVVINSNATAQTQGQTEGAPTFEVQPQISTANTIQGQVATPAGEAHIFTVQIPATQAIAQDTVTEQAVASIWPAM